MGTPTFIGYAGTINRNGINSSFNINNDNPVTMEIVPKTVDGVPGDLILSTGDTNTIINITASDGTVIALDLTGALVEYGTTGIMLDGFAHPYVIITVDGVDYMFLEDIRDPYAVPINPFDTGNQNPLDPDDSGYDDDHEVCFVNGTLILTSDGARKIEDLEAGDLVLTRDNGVQRIRWVGARKLTGLRAAKHAPIRIAAGAFGKGMPERDLLVSPQHRILISDWRAELLFGVPEVLVAAKHLVNDSTIRVDRSLNDFSYHHILFERHETVFSEGLPTESFHPGDMAMSALDQAARAEVLELFPELAAEVPEIGETSHIALKAFEAKALLR